MRAAAGSLSATRNLLQHGVVVTRLENEQTNTGGRKPAFKNSFREEQLCFSFFLFYFFKLIPNDSRERRNFAALLAEELSKPLENSSNRKKKCQRERE